MKRRRAPKRKRTTDAAEILHRRYFEGKPERLAKLEEARADHNVALKVDQLRESASLRQAVLANLVGTTTWVIGRLEDTEYSGHSLTMLR